MKNRKPFQLKNTLIVYNVAQVVFSIILVIEVSTIQNSHFMFFLCVCEYTCMLVVIFRMIKKNEGNGH